MQRMSSSQIEVKTLLESTISDRADVIVMILVQHVFKEVMAMNVNSLNLSPHQRTRPLLYF